MGTKKSTDNFFAVQTRSSKIKAKIVSDYFPKYCKIIMKYRQEEIRYFDLFSGPGLYEDGSPSTPILIGEACATDSTLANTVRLMFNDYKYCEALKTNFTTHFSTTTFKYQPIFGDKTVGEDERIHKYLTSKFTDDNGRNKYPTLLFVDPFGYKGVNTKALATFLQSWGNEIFLFVNIKRIHAAVENEKFDELMEDLFPTTINTIRRDRKYVLRVEDRLNLIIENLADEYKSMIQGELFYTAFKFQEEDNTATSHYILHFTKHPRGYDLVKQIYQDFDNVGAILERDGTYAFDAKKLDTDQDNGLDFGDQNIGALSIQLTEKYKGIKIQASKLFNEHQALTKYSRKHYIETLRKMVSDGILVSNFTDTSEHKVTVLISEHCWLQFN